MMGLLNQMSSTEVVGNERFKADKRQIAGTLLALSITVAFFPLARLAPLINRDGGTANEGIGLWALIGNLIAMAIGTTGMMIGWMSMTHDYSSPRLTGAFLILEQLAFIPYVVDIVNIGKMANTGAAFIPPIYNPTPANVWFVGAMGMVGAATFCLFLFGSVALLGFAHMAYQTGQVETRPGSYYRGRLVFYCFVMTLAGLAQLVLGAYIIINFGNGPLPAPIGVAMFMIHFPEIAVFVGSIYVLNGVFGMYRGLTNKTNNTKFQITMGIQWMCTLFLMVLVQTSYAPGNAMAAAGPTIANLTLGVHVIPAFLDVMSRNVPDDVDAEYYGINDDHAKKEEEEEVAEQPRQDNEDAC